ncbi:MAG: hypothetical protein OXI43_20115 [Candidatus Poribacteria bacterium]|nr:hypothetical protein [Candidatus Poribacteria bacterium]
MLNYANFINQKTTFTPRLIIEIGGEDVSHLYVEGSLKTDQVLDTPSFNVWTTGVLRFSLRNTDNRFNTRNTSNFFTELGRDASGWRTFVIVSVIFENDTDAPTTPITFFSGFVEEVNELPHVRSVRILALDFSAHLQNAPLDDFGASFRDSIVGPDGTPQYSELSPIYNFPDNAAPISYRSVSISLQDDDDNEVDITILTSLPEEGIFADYKYAGIDYDAGLIYFGGEPPNGSSTSIDVKYKGAYRYRTPEFLILELLEHTRVYEGLLSSDEMVFAKSLLKSPVVESALPVVSSHGRPYFQREAGSLRISSVIRWIDSEDKNGVETFYFGGDRNLLNYVRRDDSTGKLDAYGIISQCPDPSASILQFVRDGDIFYVLTASSWRGIQARLWKVQGQNWELSRGGSWVTYTADATSDEQATVAHFYDDFLGAGGQQDIVADNRKNLVDYGDYIYFLYDNFSNGLSESARRIGLKRIHKGTGVVETLFRIGYPGRYSIDFAIKDNEIYVFYCLRHLDMDSHFRVMKHNISGTAFVPDVGFDPDTDLQNAGSWEDVFFKIWGNTERSRPAMVSDVVVRDDSGRLKFYFVLTYSRRVTRRGYAELCKLDFGSDTPSFPITDTSSSGLSVLKRYEDMLFSARSLVVHEDDNIYFVEGQWVSGLSDVTDYPTFDDCGHLFRLDLMDTIWDLGPAWRSHRDASKVGRGMHTAFASNIHPAQVDDSKFTEGTLHFISGYGLSARYPSSDDRSEGRGSVQTNTLSREVKRQDNWVWLQYGKKLSTKVPVFPTNGKYVWPLIEELARIVDYEVGWVPGDREIEAFDRDDLTLRSRSYLFFRPRSEIMVEVSVDESVYVNLGSQLDTVQIFNSVSMTFGGHVHFSEDVLDDDDGQADLIRNFHIFTDCLSGKDRGWAEAICDRVLNRQKERRLKTRLPLKFSPYLQLGDILKITSEYHSLSDRPYRVTEVLHNTESWQTEIECREDLESIESLMLPIVGDRVYVEGVDIVKDFLPVASGGQGPYTYSLVNADTPVQDFNSDSLLVGVTFSQDDSMTDDVELPRLEGTPTAATIRNVQNEDMEDVSTVVPVKLRYTVTDSSNPPQSVSRDFQVIVLGSAGVLTLPEIELLHIRKDCEQKIVLKAATGGVPPYSYELVDFELDDVDHSGSLYFDGASREIRGIEESGYIGTAKYRVTDSIGNTAETAEFPVLVEEGGIWSGLYYASDKVGLLHNGASGQGRHREYDYVAGENGRKARSIPVGNPFGTPFDFSVTHTGVTSWNGCCATGNFRVFVGQAGGNGFGSVFEGTSGAGSPVDLGAGDWRDVIDLGSNKVGFFDFDTGAFRAYTVSSSGLVDTSGDVLLNNAAGEPILVDLVSAVVHDNKIWGIVRGSDALLVWDVATGNLVVETVLFKYPVMIEGITDWVGITRTSNHFLLLRSGSTRVFAFSDTGERSVDDDLKLYG